MLVFTNTSTIPNMMEFIQQLFVSKQKVHIVSLILEILSILSVLLYFANENSNRTGVRQWRFFSPELLTHK